MARTTFMNPRPQPVKTRLSVEETEKLRELAFVKRKKQSEVLREAVQVYLMHENQVRVNELEGIYAIQVKMSTDELVSALEKCTNRICAMLAKVGVDSHAVYQFLGRLDENSQDLMVECTTIARKRLSNRSTQEDQAVSGVLKQAMRA